MKFIIAEIFWPRQSSLLWRGKQTENKYVTTRSNMSTVMKQGAEINYKSFTTQVFMVVGLLVEFGSAISKSKGYLEESPSIS